MVCSRGLSLNKRADIAATEQTPAKAHRVMILIPCAGVKVVTGQQSVACKVPEYPKGAQPLCI